MEPLPEKAYRYYRERTGPLGALTCASSVDDEAAASDDAFGHVPPAEGWAAIAMPCGTGKTTLTRRYASEESLPVRLLDVDAILAKHDDYPRFSDWMEARIDSNRVNWAQLNSWRDRLLRDRLEHERVAGKLNVVLVHGRSTATKYAQHARLDRAARAAVRAGRARAAPPTLLRPAVRSDAGEPRARRGARPSGRAVR